MCLARQDFACSLNDFRYTAIRVTSNLDHVGYSSKGEYEVFLKDVVGLMEVHLDCLVDKTFR